MGRFLGLILGDFVTTDRDNTQLFSRIAYNTGVARILINGLREMPYYTRSKHLMPPCFPPATLLCE
jgi:hypothetical protein